MHGWFFEDCTEAHLCWLHILNPSLCMDKYLRKQTQKWNHESGFRTVELGTNSYGKNSPCAWPDALLLRLGNSRLLFFFWVQWQNLSIVPWMTNQLFRVVTIHTATEMLMVPNDFQRWRGPLSANVQHLADDLWQWKHFSTFIRTILPTKAASVESVYTALL